MHKALSFISINPMVLRASAVLLQWGEGYSRNCIKLFRWFCDPEDHAKRICASMKASIFSSILPVELEVREA